jgi:hypothetical protein
MENTATVRAMVAMHEGLRREFASLPLLVKSIAEGDTERATLVSEHITLLMELLAAQLDVETSLLQAAADSPASVSSDHLRRLIDGYDTLDAQGGEILDLAEQWAATPDVTNRAELHRSLIAFERLLLAQLGRDGADTLERALLLAGAAEPGSPEARVWSSVPADRRILGLRLLLDSSEPADADALLSALDEADRADYERAGSDPPRAYKARLLGG